MTHPINAGYEPGNHWTSCQRCRGDRRVSDLRKQWNGLLVCSFCFDPKHPMESPRQHIVDDQQPKGLVSPAPAQQSSGVDFQDIAETIPSGTFDGNNGTF